MKFNQILPAVPGTKMAWYNHCTDTTQEEAVLFWAVEQHPDNGGTYVLPCVAALDCATWIAFEFPQNEKKEGESYMLWLEIPGWGKIPGTGCFREAKGEGIPNVHIPETIKLT